jgi:integrase
MGAVVAFPQKPRTRAQAERVALTELRVAQLKKAGFARDLKTIGLGVRVSSSGAQAYVWERKVNGKSQRILLGKPPGLRLEDARRAAERLNGLLAAGGDPRAERRSRRLGEAAKGLTLAKAFEAFEGARGRRRSTRVDHAFLFGRWVPASLQRKAVETIARADIEAAMAAVIKAGHPRTGAKLVAFLRAVLNHAGRRSDNPCSGVETPKPNRRERRLSLAEVGALLNVLERRRGELWADFVAIALLTGARRANLSAMRWENLDLDASLWFVPAESSKNGRELAIALPKLAVAVLQARRPVVVEDGEGGWVWRSEKGAHSGHVAEPRKPLAELLRQAGVERHLSLHDLRRTVGSRLAANGANAATIQAALGHLSPQSAKAYLHLDVGVARGAVEKALGLDDSPLDRNV